jgi:hypothetical protein
MEDEKAKKFPLPVKLHFCPKRCKLCKEDLEVIDVKKKIEEFDAKKRKLDGEKKKQD